MLFTESRDQEFAEAEQQPFMSFTAVTVRLTGRHILLCIHIRHMLLEADFSEGA